MTFQLSSICFLTKDVGLCHAKWVVTVQCLTFDAGKTTEYGALVLCQCLK